VVGAARDADRMGGVGDFARRAPIKPHVHRAAPVSVRDRGDDSARRAGAFAIPPAVARRNSKIQVSVVPLAWAISAAELMPA
jgi:hypothetical protein